MEDGESGGSCKPEGHTLIGNNLSGCAQIEWRSGGKEGGGPEKADRDVGRGVGGGGIV